MMNAKNYLKTRSIFAIYIIRYDDDSGANRNLILAFKVEFTFIAWFSLCCAKVHFFFILMMFFIIFFVLQLSPFSVHFVRGLIKLENTDNQVREFFSLHGFLFVIYFQDKKFDEDVFVEETVEAGDKTLLPVLCSKHLIS